MKIYYRQSRRILTRQKGGFLGSDDPHSGYTHTLNPYTGCGFGKTACGAYCYAQYLAWAFRDDTDDAWGDAVYVKENAPDLLHNELKRMTTADRQRTRIFMSSATDPYQPVEARERLTRRLLDVFAEYTDTGLLLIQTRSPLVTQDIDRIQALPFSWVSFTIETDRDDLMREIRPGGPGIQARLQTVSQLVQAHIPVQIAVSPCLPYSPEFADRLLATGAERIIVDTLVDGDGQSGQRTQRSPFGQMNLSFNWRDATPARQLYQRLQQAVSDGQLEATGWSDSGFASVPSQHIQDDNPPPRQARLL
jgi:DNA repair photolyase